MPGLGVSLLHAELVDVCQVCLLQCPSQDLFFCVCECFAYVHINHHVSVFEVQERVSEAVELEVEMW